MPRMTKTQAREHLKNAYQQQVASDRTKLAGFVRHLAQRPTIEHLHLDDAGKLVEEVNNLRDRAEALLREIGEW